MSGAVSLGRPSRPPFWKFQWRREQRPDAAAVVAASGLPDAAAAFVVSVVKRCRLWREERVEVARELCSHLGEGLDRGESVEGLIAGFGDARTAARLITRAKRRCRPWWWRAQRDTRRGVGCLLLLGLCWYGYHAAWFYLGRPRVTFSVVSKMNEGSVSVPLEERAWPVYREAYLAFRDAGDVWPKIEGTDRGLLIEIERSLTGTERARVGAFAELFASTVRAYRRASAMPKSGFVVGDMAAESSSWNPEEWKRQYRGEQELQSDNWAQGVLLPQLSVYGAAGDMLSLDAVRSIDAGDAATAVEDVRAMLRIARHAPEDGSLVAQMVGARLLTAACATVREVMASPTGRLDERQLIELMHAMIDYRVHAQSASRVDTSLETAMFDDVLQRMYTDDGNGNGHLTKEAMSLGGSGRFGRSRVEQLIGPALSAIVEDRKGMKAAYERVMDVVNEQLGEPLYRRDPKAVEAQARRVRGGVFGRGGSALIEDLTGALLASQRSVDLALCRRDATVARLGCELFKVRNGRYPAGWDELVPGILPRAPMDPWTGRSLGYRVDAGELDPGRPLIYSAGSDKTDDGGVFTRLAQTDIWQGKDWALWPTLPPPPERAGGMTAGFAWDWISAFWGR